MKEVLVTRAAVLKATKAQVAGENLSTSCAMWQALAPLVDGEISVTESKAYSSKKDISYRFKPSLPMELYGGQYDIALAKIRKHGPYRFQVEGLE